MKKIILFACLISGLIRGAPTDSSGGDPTMTPVTAPARNLPSGRSGTNVVSSSNQIGMATNQLQNTNTLIPPADVSSSNALNNNFVLRDQTVTDNDKSILTTLRQNVQTLLGVPSPESLPVHFQINDGAVTVVGTVETPRARLRILLLARQTAGVTKIFDEMHIGTPPANVQPQ